MATWKSSTHPESGPVVEVKERLGGPASTYRCRWRARGPESAVVYYALPDEIELHGLVIPRGAFSLGYFWQNRPFNVYHLFSPKGDPLAFYCNVADRTRIDRDRICWRDLVVDVLIEPRGGCRVLDEDELPADLDAGLRTYINDARDRLVRDRHVLIDDLNGRSRHWLAMSSDDSMG